VWQNHTYDGKRFNVLNLTNHRIEKNIDNKVLADATVQKRVHLTVLRDMFSVTNKQINITTSNL